LSLIPHVRTSQGSGKTLAYGLPILNYLLTTPRATKSKRRRPVRALILAPTRELALQVCNHLKNCLVDPIKKEPDEEGGALTKAGGSKVPNKPPAVSVAAIVGGMSQQKQKRVLERGVDVLVATPGRLWDILSQVCVRRRRQRDAEMLTSGASRMMCWRHKSSSSVSSSSTKPTA